MSAKEKLFTARLIFFLFAPPPLFFKGGVGGFFFSPFAGGKRPRGPEHCARSPERSGAEIVARGEPSTRRDRGRDRKCGPNEKKSYKILAGNLFFVFLPPWNSLCASCRGWGDPPRWRANPRKAKNYKSKSQI